MLEVQGQEGASRKTHQAKGAKASDAGSGTGVGPGKLEGRKTSINKAEVGDPQPETERRVSSSRMKLERPRRICSLP